MCGCRASSIENIGYYTPKKNKSCSKDKEYYRQLLEKVDTQLKNHLDYLLFNSVVNSQINAFDNNCNLFEEYITNKIEPLIT